MMKTKFTSLSIKKQDLSKTVKFFVNEKSGVIVCRLYDRWFDTYHTAKTRCHDADAWNEKKGRAVAFNKARQKELDFNIARLDEERKLLDQWYNQEISRINKTQHLNVIYLTGVQEELKDLLK